jgi:hypothetical protein
MRGLIALLFLLQLLIPPQRALAQSAPSQTPQGAAQVVDLGGEARDRLQLTLTATAAGPNTATLVVAATPFYDAPGVEISWETGNARLADGPPAETSGAVAAHATTTQARTVTFPGAGIYPLGVLATYALDEGTRYGASGMVFALVEADGTVRLTDMDPNAVNPMHSIMLSDEENQGMAASTPDADPNATQDSCVTVRGRVTRIDRMNTRTGRAAPTTVPVRNALIEIRESDTLFDDSYGKKLTNANGEYSFSFCDDDGWFDDELEVYIRLRAELRSGGFTVVEVEDSSWIDEVYEYDSNIIETEGGTFTRNFSLNEEQSSVFNIADAVFEAWTVWNDSGGAKGDDAIFDYSGEVHWEPGYGDTGSYYNPFWDEITIADDPSDPDEWDDSVIMHEWGHMADDKYGCDDNPGGQHSFGSILADPELAWGEGYPDYWQSVVRTATGATDGNFYIDANGAGTNRITLNMETIPTIANGSVEDSVARMLWDLQDTANDGSDRTGFGHNTVQEVYTDPAFESNGDIFDDTCTVFVYLMAWRDIGKPTDADTAASVTQNVGLSNPFVATAATSADAAQAAAVQQIAATNVAGGSPEDYVWWQKVTMVVDNSASMAGAKFDAAKTVMQEQVNDLTPAPKGVEFGVYTFNNVLPASQEAVRGRFYADEILPVINGLATRPPGEAAEPCTVNAFSALAAATQDKFNGEAWVYTDGDTTLNLSVEAMQQFLTVRGLHGSFVLMGGCASSPGEQPNTIGPAYNFLGKAANATQPTGIVPYLLTAIGSGGQFLFVNEAQLADAADILRAQLSHSAGAGRWSDYVSDSATYSWDKLTSWEYNWVDADDDDDDDGDGQPDTETFLGRPGTNPVAVALPMSFPVYGSNYTSLRAHIDGYLQMGSAPSGPIVVLGSRFLNVLYKPNLGWLSIICAAETAAPDCGGGTQAVITQDAGDWFAITTEGDAASNGQPRAFQALLNKSTGEIRYQYRILQPGDAGGAVISVKSTSFVITNPVQEVVVSNMDANGANNGTGYKLVPMPPQPTKLFTVPVDSQTGSVGFLLTGYSGSFDPLAVTYPDGSAVNCADTGNVLCLNLGLVQYVQADVDGRTGVWQAAVSAGSTGEGTFSFSTLAASAISASSSFDHQLALGQPAPIFVKLGTTATGNQLSAWLQRPDGSRMGSEFTLFDDGAHGDRGAGDGLFGLPDFVPTAEGVAYLNVRATVNGETIQRTDPTPYNFQPFSIVGPAEVAALGAEVAIDYTMTNLSDTRYCYTPQFQLPEGWSATWAFTLGEVINGFCLNPGEAATRTLNLTAPSLGGVVPPRTSGEIALSFRESERGQISDAITTKVTRFNPPATVAIENHYTSSYVRPNATDTVSLTVGVFDAEGYPAADGTLVNLATTLGTVTPPSGPTVNGQLPFVFTAGNTPGDALITASVGGLTATTLIYIETAFPETVVLAVTPTDLRTGTTANLVATVQDEWGSPVAGATVRVGVENDGQSGTVADATSAASSAAPTAIAASEVVTLTTDAQGRVSAVFTKQAGALGSVGVGAELLFDDGTGLHVAAESRVIILLDDVARGAHNLFLPGLRTGE